MSSLSFWTSLAKTCSGGAVLSIQLALMEIRRPPPVLRKYLALMPTIL